MSHFTTVATEIKSLDTLREALADLGMRVREGANVRVRGWAGQALRSNAPIPMAIDFGRFDIGVVPQPQGDGYGLVGDWYGLQHIDGAGTERELTESICQRYAYRTVVNTLTAEGYSFEEAAQPDGSVQVVATKWE